MFDSAVLAAAAIVVAHLIPTLGLAGSADSEDARAEHLVDWMLDHPDDVSILVTGGPPSGALTWNAEVERPLGSTFKTIVLAAYAREVAAGRVDPEERVPLDDVERWLVAGTDGGSHALMVERFAAADGVRVDDLAAAMMAYSANSATDELLDRLGHARVVETAVALGLPELGRAAAPPAGALGLLRDDALGATVAARLDTLARMDGNSANAAAWHQFEAFAADPGAPDDTLAAVSELATWNQQLQLTDVMPWRARPADMHELLVRLLIDGRLGPQATSIVERHLSWPLDDPTLAAKFTRLAAKEGAAPGTLVVHGSGTPRTGSAAGMRRTIVVSVHHLDAESWLGFFEGDATQALGIRLLEDPALVAELGQALSQ